MAVALSVMVSGAATAGIVNIGDPEDGNSWYQEFYGATSTSVDHLQFGMVSGSGSDFKVPSVVHDFSESAWSQVYATPTLAIAEGDPTDYLEFTMSFTGEHANGAEFYAEAYSGTTFLQGTLLVYDDGWTVTDYTDGSKMGYAQAPASAPLPAAGWLGFGLLGVATALRRLRRRVS